MKLIDLYPYLTIGQKLHVRLPIDTGTEESFEVVVMKDQRFGEWREEYGDWLEALDLYVDNIASGSDSLMITCKSKGTAPKRRAIKYGGSADE